MATTTIAWLTPTIGLEPYSDTQLWSPRPPRPWPGLDPADMRALLRLRKVEPNAVLHHDPAAGMFFVEFGDTDTGHRQTPSDALAYALEHANGDQP